MKPPTVEQAEARGLFVEKGIHTFSNGTQWDYWADANCYECRYYDRDEVGACAFEAASILGMVSPALALLFGWTQHPEYADSWNEPESCRFFRARGDDSGDDVRPDDSPDPLQLVLLADPTEDAVLLTQAAAQPVEVPA